MDEQVKPGFRVYWQGQEIINRPIEVTVTKPQIPIHRPINVTLTWRPLGNFRQALHHRAPYRYIQLARAERLMR